MVQTLTINTFLRGISFSKNSFLNILFLRATKSTKCEIEFDEGHAFSESKDTHLEDSSMENKKS